MDSLSLNQTKKLERAAAGISGRIAKHLAEAQKQARTALARHDAEDKKRRQQFAAKLKKERQMIDVRMPFARKGLARILAVGASKPMQDILDAFGRTAYPAITFYEVSRPSGDAWDTNGKEGSGTRDVRVTFCKQHVEIVYGGFAVHSAALFRLFHQPDSPDKAFEREGGWGDDGPDTDSLETFLGHVAQPLPIDLSVIENWEQRVYEWDPEEVLFQLLVNCAQARSFDKYLMRCLKKIDIP